MVKIIIIISKFRIIIIISGVIIGALLFNRALCQGERGCFSSLIDPGIHEVLTEAYPFSHLENSRSQGDPARHFGPKRAKAGWNGEEGRGGGEGGGQGAGEDGSGYTVGSLIRPASSRGPVDPGTRADGTYGEGNWGGALFQAFRNPRWVLGAAGTKPDRGLEQGRVKQGVSSAVASAAPLHARG